MSGPVQPHGLYYARPPCPSPMEAKGIFVNIPYLIPSISEYFLFNLSTIVMIHGGVEIIRT